MLAFTAHIPCVLTRSSAKSTDSISSRHALTKSTLLTRLPTAYSRVSVGVPPTCVVKSNTVKEYEDADDDDETFGQGTQLGMRVPNLTDEQQAYLDAAKTNKEFMERMQSLAKRMEQDHLIQNQRSGKQTADDYLDNLPNMKMHRSPSTTPSRDPVVIKAEDIVPSIQNKINKQEEKAEDNIQVIEEEIKRINEEIAKAEKEKEQQNIVNDNEQDDTSLESIEEEMQRINQQLVEAASLSNEEDEEEKDVNKDEKTKMRIAQFEQVQKQLQKEIRDANMEPDLEDFDSKAEEIKNQNMESSTVEREIAYLETHLEKLQRDSESDGDEEKLEEEESNTSTSSTTTNMTPSTEEDTQVQVQEENSSKESEGVSIDGLENTAGELDADEKRAAFEALRRQVMMVRGEDMPPIDNEFADPLNVTLPSKRDGPPSYQHDDYGFNNSGDDLLSKRPTREVPSMNQLVTSEDDEGGDIPTGDESEYDSFADQSLDKKLLVEELEMEMKTYTEESRKLLRNHESRMGILLGRLMTLED